jgi:hypothetical protein
MILYVICIFVMLNLSVSSDAKAPLWYLLNASKVSSICSNPFVYSWDAEYLLTTCQFGGWGIRWGMILPSHCISLWGCMPASGTLTNGRPRVDASKLTGPMGPSQPCSGTTPPTLVSQTIGPGFAAGIPVIAVGSTRSWMRRGSKNWMMSMVKTRYMTTVLTRGGFLMDTLQNVGHSRS